MADLQKQKRLRLRSYGIISVGAVHEPPNGERAMQMRWRQGTGMSVPYRAERINASVCARAFDDSQSGTGPQKTRKQRPMRLTFQSFFISIFEGLQEEPRYEANQKSNSKGGANSCVHLNEKVARQTDSENRFADISNILGKVFQSGLVENSHRIKAYHTQEKLSRFIAEYGFDPRQVEFAGIIAHNTYISGNVGIGSAVHQRRWRRRGVYVFIVEALEKKR